MLHSIHISRVVESGSENLRHSLAGGGRRTCQPYCPVTFDRSRDHNHPATTRSYTSRSTFILSLGLSTYSTLRHAISTTPGPVSLTHQSGPQSRRHPGRHDASKYPGQFPKLVDLRRLAARIESWRLAGQLDYQFAHKQHPPRGQGGQELTPLVGGKHDWKGDLYIQGEKDESLEQNYESTNLIAVWKLAESRSSYFSYINI